MVVMIGLIEKMSFKQLLKDVKIAKWISALRSLKTEGVTRGKALRQYHEVKDVEKTGKLQRIM